MKPRVWLLLSIVVAVITWFYVHRILNPWSDYVRTLRGPENVEMGDMYSPWMGSRELLLRHMNPYGAEVSHEIQMAFFGHPVYQDYANTKGIINEQRFAYPVYLVFLLAPTLHADFSDVRSWSAVVLGVLTVASLLFWLDFLHWRVQSLTLIALAIFVLSVPQTVQGLRFENLALLVAFLLALGAWCLQRNHLVAAGILFALSTIKPQMTLLPICLFMVWVCGDWKQRWRMFAGFSITLAALIGTGELLLPGWISYFIAGAEAYQHYFQAFTSLPRIWLGDGPGKVVGALIVSALLFCAYRMRKESADSRHFAVLLSFCFMGTILAFPLLIEFNQVLLILPTMMLLQDWDLLPKFSRYAAVAIFAWPWVASAALLFFPGYAHTEQRVALLPGLSAILYPVFLPVLLVSERLIGRAEATASGIRVA